MNAINTNTIKCPSCGTEIPLTEALTGQIEADLQAKYELEAARQQKAIDEIAQSLAQEQKSLTEKQNAFDSRVQEELEKRLQFERRDIAEKARTQALTDQNAAMQELQMAMTKKDTLLAQMRQEELDLRRKGRELEEKAQAAALEAQRKLDAERAAIKADAARIADEANMTKLREKDNLLAQMSEQLEAMKRKAETGSQEAQGEAQEDILIETLTHAFPFDQFEEVKKGVKGGDIVQIVRNNNGKICGRILWESKNTKAFSKQWIEKVKSDQQLVNAHLAVIVTVTLPDDFNDRGVKFGLYENVWITDLKSMTSLTAALRQGIMESDRQKCVSANQDSLQAALYEYLTSKEAAMKIQAVVEAVARMKDDLNKERSAMERIWAGREKQIDTTSKNFLGFFGGIEGLVHQKSLPEVPPAIAALENIA